MKTTTKSIAAVFIIAQALLCMSAKSESPGVQYCSSASTGCRVTAAQAVYYLQNCSHHHTVRSISSVPGSCNFSAIVENSRRVTVYVGAAGITGHLDHPGA
jgi:hypothetical protein